ncbi:MAG: NADP-dependent isocitrate dehydrogenase [Chitinivibrionia bacterium]|nr:NADP-dependent isocitrate dehydrogenase [Chitinivibrionia bacterium]
MKNGSIVYTKTDEAPALATLSLFPIIEKYLSKADVEVVQKDISLARRILAAVNNYLPENQKVSDDLEYLGKLCLEQDANIIKLPNISASVSQIKGTITELREKGFAIPEYPDNPKNNEEETVQSQYRKTLGSAVNPVIREGNSDRRAAKSVKNYAKKHPYKVCEWSKDSKTKVLSMSHGDFYASEKSITNGEKEKSVNFVFTDNDGNSKNLRPALKLLPHEILDTSTMSAKALESFVKKCMEEAQKDDIMFSFHLKATMMKISDPIIFGVILKTFFADVFTKYGEVFEKLGVNTNNGLADLYDKIKGNPSEKEIISEINKCFDKISVAMVDSAKGISSFSVPSDVIIDASMPAMIKAGGKMWDKNGDTADVLAIIPDRTYSGVYDVVVKHCKENGAFNPRTIGCVSNVGLMAQQAEEYGSHDKTFEITADGIVQITDENGAVLMEQKVEKGDIFRASQCKHAAVLNWVRLAVERGKITGEPVIFWLDVYRAHDREVVKKVVKEMGELDLADVDVRILSPENACAFSVKRMVEGLNTISATGNVLRDYLTDLFPIIELGTSAKMLSIVPLMNGGGLYETGAGGTAPKHVSALTEENFLRWDSLGEFMAIVPSLEKYAETHGNARAKILAETLDTAIENILENQKSPERAPVGIDNRGSHFYLALYWAKALAEQKKDVELAKKFEETAKQLTENEEKIVAQFLSVQKSAVDLGGYYLFDEEKAKKIMRPSEIFNRIIDGF